MRRFLGRRMLALPWMERIIISGSALFAVTSASAGALGQGEQDQISWWRVGSSLVLCLMIGAGAAFALKNRLGDSRPTWLPRRIGRRLQVIECVRLSAQTSLAIVSIDEQEMLVLSGPQQAEVVGGLQKRGTRAGAELPAEP